MPEGVGEWISGLFGEAGPDGRVAGLLMAAGVTLMTLVLLRRIWKRGKAGLRRTEPAARRTESAPARQTLDAVMVEVQELTRVCAAQMENRAIRLEKLIREADERIRRLEALEGGHEPDWGGPMVEARRVRREGRSGGGSLLVEDEVDPLTRRVCALADEGMSPVEIASNLEEQVGKVELILALRSH